MSEQLVDYFWKGWIVGPHETEKQFQDRVASCKSQAEIKLDSFTIRSIPIKYSNKGLRFWEGGCSWIDGSDVTIQLRESLESKKSLLGFYSKEELLKHEAVHGLRALFDEPIYEEILAYQTSRSPIRRILGPLFRNPKESLIAMVLIALLPLLPQMAPLLGVGALALYFRLRKARKALKKTEKNLSYLTQLPTQPWLIALTDKEIILFATLSPEAIRSYASKQVCLRWKQLNKVFL